MNNNLILDYIRATTNLYGIVPLEKVVEIYNQQNDDQVSIEDVEPYLDKDLSKSYVYAYDDYFVHETIAVFDEFELVLAKKGDKPYYVPEKDELLKYADVSYYEKPKQYQELFKCKRQSNHTYSLLCSDEIMSPSWQGSDFFDPENQTRTVDRAHRGLPRQWPKPKSMV